LEESVRVIRVTALRTRYNPFASIHRFRPYVYLSLLPPLQLYKQTINGQWCISIRFLTSICADGVFIYIRPAIVIRRYVTISANKGHTNVKR